ncbi:MAG: helix-turn-helix transcriptional regulator [Pseudomonadota bacterium]
MQIETIKRAGKEFAILPISELRQLIENSEMLSDVKALDNAKLKIEKGEDEIIPFEMIERRINGESPIKIWREYRDITQQKLANNSGVSRTMIAAIESGSKKGGLTTLKKLALALNVSLDNIV